MSNEEAIEKLASQLHDEWRKPRLIVETGKYKPRMKPVKDAPAWVEKNKSKECDIANTDFKDLPIAWQAENRAVAQSAVEIVRYGMMSGKAVRSELFMEYAAGTIHDHWMIRNGDTAQLELKVHYSKLPEIEKEKDRAIVLKAIELLK